MRSAWERRRSATTAFSAGGNGLRATAATIVDAIVGAEARPPATAHQAPSVRAQLPQVGHGNLGGAGARFRPTPPARGLALMSWFRRARRLDGIARPIGEHDMKLNLASLAGLVVVGVAAGYAAAPASAADTAAAAAKSTYTKERADCEAGRTAEDRATCLREAGAAEQEGKRNQLDNNGSARQNAIERCNAVAPKDKSDCLARIEGPSKSNQTTTTSD